MKRVLLLMGLAMLGVLMFAPAAMAQGVSPEAGTGKVVPKDQAPQPVNFPPETLGPEYCGFPVLYEASGKTKSIDLPNGDTLYKNPGLRVTLTNKETDKQETYVSTGTIRATELEGGETSMVSTGQTVIHSPTIGILVLNGRFTFVEDRDGNLSQPKGNGRIIDACDQLA